MNCPDCGRAVQFSELRDPAGGDSVVIWDCATCQRSGFVQTAASPVEVSEAARS